MKPPCDHLILFDGTCNLCHASVRFIVRRDRRGRFRFAPLQSPLGQALCRGRNLNIETSDPGTMVLFTGGRVLTGSDAAIEIVRRLDSPWRLLRFSQLIPRPLRDRVYAFVSRRRHAWFGCRDRCGTTNADAAVSERFIA